MGFCGPFNAFVANLEDTTVHGNLGQGIDDKHWGSGVPNLRRWIGLEKSCIFEAKQQLDMRRMNSSDNTRKFRRLGPIG